jgi:sulfite reductase (ferredoxin)
MACTGIEYCKLAIVDTKDRATATIGELETRVPELDVPVTVNVNGCPNSCCRVQVADIGLKGMLVMDDAGNQVEGFQVHLGGLLGENPAFGRKLRAHKVTAVEVPNYIEAVTRNYLKDRAGGEPFAQWAARADEELLR